MTSAIDALLFEKPNTRRRIYAWRPVAPSPAYQGLIKVGQTTQADVNARIRQSQSQMPHEYELLTDPDNFAERPDGTLFSDTDVIRALVAQGVENPTINGAREWVRTTPERVVSTIKALQRAEAPPARARDWTFDMRAEQRDAVEQTLAYFRSRWAEDADAVPRFLWNAKMRFGKTFTAYQLAKRLPNMGGRAKRVLVVTFKPAVADSWQEDLERHHDFAGWQFMTKDSEGDPGTIGADVPLVYFGSFQDLLGGNKDKGFSPKARNRWLHDVEWDLVVFDEYHFGAWRHVSKSIFTNDEARIEEVEALEGETDAARNRALSEAAALGEALESETEFVEISSRAFLYLSGTPFRALRTGEFIEEQIFNWTYSDEQRAKAAFADAHPDLPNPYGALPQMRLLTYQMPERILDIASGGEFDEFDLNAFFETEGEGEDARFVNEQHVQDWLEVIRGKGDEETVRALKTREKPPWPYSDVRLRSYLDHSFWFMPSVASCYAMRELLKRTHNKFWHDYDVLVVAGAGAGMGPDALPPVRHAIKGGHDTKSITLSCGKLTTGVTVKQWSSILMLRNLKSPETYFQAAFRVQSPWVIRNPDGDDPTREAVVKPVCYVFDFAPTRALRQLSEYGIGLSPSESNPERAVADLVNFLPVLAYNGAVMKPVDAGEILDIAMSGTSATLLARKWESAMLVNVDNGTLRRVLDSEEAMNAVSRIEGWRKLGDNPLETIVNRSESIKDTKAKAKERDLTKAEKKQLSAEEKEFRSKRKEVQEKLIKFATRIPAFMYLTDFRENTLEDVITDIEPALFKTVTGLSVSDFHLLVRLGVFNTELMNSAVFAFRRYEEASLRYTGIPTHDEATRRGGFNTVVTLEPSQM